MPVTEVFAGIAVRRRDDAVEFYQRLLGAAPSMLPNDDEAAWQLTTGGWLYVVVDRARAGHSIATLLVDDLDDLDERVAGLVDRAVDHEPVAVVEGTVRSTWIVDPDGNRLQIAQPG